MALQVRMAGGGEGCRRPDKVTGVARHQYSGEAEEKDLDKQKLSCCCIEHRKVEFKKTSLMKFR